MSRTVPSPTIDPEPRLDRSRRLLLGGALGGLAAWVASLAGRATPASAADNDALRIGQSETGTTQTTLTASPANASAFKGVSNASDGRGVSGTAASAFGVNSGVFGQTLSVEGRGTVGFASASTASTTAVGVYGEARGGLSAGVEGKATATTLASYGVRGSAASTIGTGVYGVASHPTGATAGVRGQVSSPSGRGVIGAATAVSGNAIGVSGQSASKDGAGVFGFNSADTGPAVGVRGVAGVAGTGVFGDSRIGVHGRSLVFDGTGVVGQSLASRAGVIGHSRSGAGDPPASPTKTGVYGEASEDAASRGVHGFSTAGRGVFGESTDGVGGSFASATGFALETAGRLKFGTVSGIATIAASTTEVLVTPGTDLTSTSFVLITPRGDPLGGTYWTAIDSAANQFRIRASNSVGTARKVGWLLVG